LISVSLAALFGQTAGRAAPAGPPTVSLCGGDPSNPACSPTNVHEYLVTGNYVVGGVDLQPGTSTNGFLTDTIHMSGVPHYADDSPAQILGAYLYWETITTATDTAPFAGVKFRGQSVTPLRSAYQDLLGSTASCYSSGGGSGATYRMYQNVADVR